MPSCAPPGGVLEDERSRPVAVVSPQRMGWRSFRSLVSRCSQRSGVSEVAERSVVQITGSIPQTKSLLRPALTRQLLDPKLKLCNGALSTVGPMFKGLGLLESLRPMADCDHSRTQTHRVTRCHVALPRNDLLRVIRSGLCGRSNGGISSSGSERLCRSLLNSPIAASFGFLPPNSWQMAQLEQSEQGCEAVALPQSHG